jgi:hypothetical protein
MGIWEMGWWGWDAREIMVGAQLARRETEENTGLGMLQKRVHWDPMEVYPAMRWERWEKNQKMTRQRVLLSRW